MLRASSESHSETVDLNAVMEGGVDSGIVNGRELVAFAEAIVAREANGVARAREQLLKVVNEAQMIDAAAIASNFQRMVRIANATGIGLGRAELATEELRESLGINAFRHHDQ